MSGSARRSGWSCSNYSRPPACAADAVRAAGNATNGRKRVPTMWPDYRTPRRLGTAASIRKVRAMLFTIAIVLLILWALGLVTSYTLGGLIHILLVIAP